MVFIFMHVMKHESLIEFSQVLLQVKIWHEMKPTLDMKGLT